MNSSRIIELYNQVEELLDRMGIVLPFVDLYELEVNEDYIDDLCETLDEFSDYLDYIEDYHFSATKLGYNEDEEYY